MNQMIPKPFPWVATLCMLAGVAVLLKLGHWQQERLVWKEALQAAYDREFALPADELPLLSAADLDRLKDTDIRRGTVEGKLDFSKQIALQGQIAGGKAATYHLIPLLLQDGRSVFVVAGYSTGADKLPEPSTRARTDRISGVAKLPGWNRFTPQNDPERDLWFRAEVEQMALVLRLASPVKPLFYAEFMPYKLDALPQVKLEHKLRNDHRQYMFFWYGMAAVLVIIYGLRFWRQPHLRKSD